MRNSSFELLRIGLILAIMIGHVNCWYIGSHHRSELEHIASCMYGGATFYAVNAFMLISGWFGINNGFKKIKPIAIQLFACTIPFAIWFSLTGEINLFSFDGICKYIFGGDHFWFIFDYIGLLLFAPLLNVVVEHTDKRDFKIFLIGSYFLILLFDVLFRTTILGVEGGFSLIWFVYLYLLARYVRKYGCKLLEKYKWYAFIFCCIGASIAIYLHIGVRYTNPLTLISSICLILIIKDVVFVNKAINFIAAGSLIAYMLHMQPCLTPYIRRFLSASYSNHSTIVYFCETRAIILGVFALSVGISYVLNRMIKR